MSFDNGNILAYTQGKSFNSKHLQESLTGVARLVLRRHYGNHIHDEDLEALGVCKGLHLLKSSHVKKSGDLFNFLYAGMRNEIGNWLKREKRGSEIRKSDPPYFRQHGASFNLKKHPAFANLREGTKEILDRLRALGLDLSRETDRFFNTLDHTTLGEYAHFAIRASAVRTLIAGESV